MEMSKLPPNIAELDLYQMQYNEELPIYKDPNLEPKCFPTLYPKGRYHHQDKHDHTKVSHNDFIRHKLYNSITKKFARNLKWIFSKYNEKIIRQIGQGMYTVVGLQYKNTVKTAGQMQDKLSMRNIDELQINMNTFWSKIRFISAIIN